MTDRYGRLRSDHEGEQPRYDGDGDHPHVTTAARG
jgi:hypothetical protein